MTVISAMKFSRDEGAIVADEESSYFGIMWRKSKTASKIYQLTNGKDVVAVMGGSGARDILYEVSLAAPKLIEERMRHENQRAHITDGSGMVDALNYTMRGVKKKHVDSYLESRFRISEADFQAGSRPSPDGSGRLPLHESILRHYLEGVQSDENLGGLLSNAFLVLTHDPTGIQLYSAMMNTGITLPIAAPYNSIGSGQDMADEELSNFFEETPRKDRENIDKVKGLVALLSATEKAITRNIGVGGTPLIGILTEKRVVTPDEPNSKLAGEIVKSVRKGLLPKGFDLEAVETLCYQNRDFEAVEKAMWEKTADQTRLSRMLRGYKV